MIQLNITIEDINRAIIGQYKEGSDVSDLLLRDEKDLKNFIYSAIDYYLNPPSTSSLEQAAFRLGQHYSK